MTKFHVDVPKCSLGADRNGPNLQKTSSAKTESSSVSWGHSRPFGRIFLPRSSRPGFGRNMVDGLTQHQPKKEEKFRIYTPPIMEGLTHQGVFCPKRLNSWWPPIQAPTCSMVRIACYKKVMNIPGVRWSLLIDDHKWPRYTQIRFYVGQK